VAGYPYDHKDKRGNKSEVDGVEIYKKIDDLFITSEDGVKITSVQESESSNCPRCRMAVPSDLGVCLRLPLGDPWMIVE
jgi:hypothetical protein